MNADGTAISDTQRGNTYKLAWTAYVGPSVMLLVWCAFSIALAPIGWKLTVAALAIGFGRFVYRVLWLNTVELFTDAAGVWVQRGLLPWNRGAYGVRWHDAEDAVMFTGLPSWLTKSYRVKVRNRFRGHSEIDLKHVRQGDDAVRHINQRQESERRLDRLESQLAREGAIQ